MIDNRGLHGKFYVQRVDGKDQPGCKHAGCKYFVLDLTHDPHAIPAIRAYIDSCRSARPMLANDLLIELETIENDQKTDG